MRSLKRPSRTDHKHAVRSPELPINAVEPFESDDSVYETYEMFRVVCPDCARPIALLADEDALPEHALCPTPWNPFGLTVCPGSGRGAAEAQPAEEPLDGQEQDAALLLTLPEGLHWRMQPFSHVGGAGARPMRVPRMRPRR